MGLNFGSGLDYGVAGPVVIPADVLRQIEAARAEQVEIDPGSPRPYSGFGAARFK